MEGLPSRPQEIGGTPAIERTVLFDLHVVRDERIHASRWRWRRGEAEGRVPGEVEFANQPPIGLTVSRTLVKI